MNATSRVLVWAFLGSLVGCAGDDDGDLEGEVEIFSWWVNPGEAEALEALLGVVNDRYPQIDVRNSAVNKFFEEVKAELDKRLIEGDPPDTFQVHGGAELIDTWVAPAGQASQNIMEPLNFLYEEEGWYNSMPPALIEELSFANEVYSVPVNIHRGNVIYYNQALVGTLKLSHPELVLPPEAFWSTWEEFFAVADAFQEQGVIPLALGGESGFSLGMILDSGLLAKGGADYYRAFFDGAVDPQDPEGALRRTVDEILVPVRQYIQPDAAFDEWPEAADLVANGTAAMTLMGDWCKGYLDEKGIPDLYGQVPAPGTGGKFVFITDTFGLPRGAPHRENAIALLRVIGSLDAQNAFNPIKGSIPARSDVDITAPEYMNPWTQQTLQDYRIATANRDLVPSMAHGSAASPAFLADVNEALAAFLANGDGNALVREIVNAYPRLQG